MKITLFLLQVFPKRNIQKSFGNNSNNNHKRNFCLNQRNNDAFAVVKLDSIKIKETDCPFLIFFSFFHYNKILFLILKQHKKKDLSLYLRDLADTTVHTRLSDGFFSKAKKSEIFFILIKLSKASFLFIKIRT